MSSQLISTLMSSMVPILVTLFFAWLGNRTDKAQRKNIIEDAKSRIDLINEYVTAQSAVVDDPKELGEIKRTAANELHAIKTFLDNKLPSLEKSSKTSREPLQHFFLLYKMNTFGAGFYRILFFVALAFSVIWSALTFTYGPTATNPLVINLIIEIIYILPVILIALLFRWLAIKSDKPLNPAQ